MKIIKTNLNKHKPSDSALAFLKHIQARALDYYAKEVAAVSRKLESIRRPKDEIPKSNKPTK